MSHKTTFHLIDVWHQICGDMGPMLALATDDVPHDVTWSGVTIGPIRGQDWVWSANQGRGSVVMMWWPSVVIRLTQTRPRVTTGECTLVSHSPQVTSIRCHLGSVSQSEARAGGQWPIRGQYQRVMVSSAHTDVTMTWPPQVPVSPPSLPWPLSVCPGTVPGRSLVLASPGAPPWRRLSAVGGTETSFETPAQGEQGLQGLQRTTLATVSSHHGASYIHSINAMSVLMQIGASYFLCQRIAEKNSRTKSVQSASHFLLFSVNTSPHLIDAIRIMRWKIESDKTIFTQLIVDYNWSYLRKPFNQQLFHVIILIDLLFSTN